MDGTTDLLLPFIEGKKEVFRFNVDLWAHYEIRISEAEFFFADPIGRTITQGSCSGMYLRKAYFLDEERGRPTGGDIETWCQFQVRSIVDGIYSICQENGLVRLVERNADRRLSKVFQMRSASIYFNVPRWVVTTCPEDSGLDDPVVCKGLSSTFLGDFRSLFTTEVALRNLSPGYPWLIQELINADGDLTVVYAAGRIFSFFREKARGEPVDYREINHGQDTGWSFIEIPSGLEESIRKYMNHVNLSFGRIDFLVRDDAFYFLEVNPNGQFAWLDPENTSGLLGWIAECISV